MKLQIPPRRFPCDRIIDYDFLLEESPFINLKEDFLQYVWRTQKINIQGLQTTEGEPLQILSFGQLNHYDGPDFLEAKIKIGDTLFFGNIEIHLRSSDWIRHRHRQNPRYNTVILHVVLVEDEIIFHKDKSRIPCVELKTRIPNYLSSNYLKLANNENWIFCQKHFTKIPSIFLSLWLDRLLVERLERKTTFLKECLKLYKNDWESVCFYAICKGFGSRKNAEAFTLLAQKMPISILLKHRNKIIDLEALLFGQAGMLDKEFKEDYPNQLRKNYLFFKHKYKLEPIQNLSWTNRSLRPANFPTIRIAQLAMLLHQTNHLCSSILDAENIEDLNTLFHSEVSTYWQNHYVLDKESSFRKKTIGKSMMNSLIINSVVPFLFIYGKYKGEDQYKERAIHFLEKIPAEKNMIIEKWKEIGVDISSAYHSQALLELKNSFCNQRRCLECNIGHQVLNIRQ